jgi:sensor domain CHASE-containing protein
MSTNEKLKQYLQPAVLAIFLFAILLTGVFAFTNYKSGIWKKDVRMDVLDMLSLRKSNLEKALYSRIYYTRGVAAYVALNPDINNAEYAQLAKEYIRQDSVINSMA